MLPNTLMSLVGRSLSQSKSCQKWCQEGQCSLAVLSDITQFKHRKTRLLLSCSCLSSQSQPHNYSRNVMVNSIANASTWAVYEKLLINKLERLVILSHFIAQVMTYKCIDIPDKCCTDYACCTVYSCSSSKQVCSGLLSCLLRPSLQRVYTRRMLLFL